jgi:uracil-DNA glycosylase family 4
LAKKIPLRQRILECTACGLCDVGNGPVSFSGPRSDIMVIGEAPGRTEDRMGKPFVGPAGQFLFTNLRKAGAGVAPADVFVANAVSCFPERTPTDSEITACRGNLYNQVIHCDPLWILALGRTANDSLGGLGEGQAIGEIHGEWYEIGWGGVDRKVMPTYHPSAVMRNKLLMRTWREDLKEFANEVYDATER